MDNSFLKDEMTGLITKTELLWLMEEKIQKQMNFSLVLIDMDNFRKINEELGHLGGDEVLKKMASILKSNVSEKNIVARYGGEEYVILLNDLSVEEALFFTEDIRRYIDSSPLEFKLNNELISAKITFSGGVSSFPKDGKDSSELLRKADSALYRAKIGGRNRVLISIEEKMTLKSCYYSNIQLEKLKLLSKKTDKTESLLLRDALDNLLKEGVKIYEKNPVHSIEDLKNFTNKEIQLILKEIEIEELAISLKGVSPEIIEKFFSNMSKRAVVLVSDKISELGMVKVGDVKKMHQKILEIAIQIRAEF